jgi:leucyl aminopeptidase (aminopeptidase T)
MRVDFGLMTPAARVVDELLSVRPTDHVVIVHDEANANVAVAFENASAERGALVDRVAWGSPGQRPLAVCPAEVLSAIAGATATVLAVTWEEGEYDARYALVAAAGAARTRHVHMIGTGRRAFIGSMMASTGRVFDLLQALRASMRPASKIAVRSPAGTQLEIEMAPHLRWFANGHAVVPGQWINVPFGALITSPATASGIYVVDASVGGGVGARAGLLEGRPIRLRIEGGRVRRVDCRDIALKRYVETFMAEGQNRDRIGLLSLGANLGIREPLGEIVHDENMPGVHLSLGDAMSSRTGATWTAHGQLSFAGAFGDVDLDGDPLIRRARYVRFV